MIRREPIRLGILGSPCLVGNPAARGAVVTTITGWLSQARPGCLEIVTGGDPGVGEMAERVALHLELPLAICRPDPAQLAGAKNAKEAWPAYRARNELLLGHITHLICIRCPVASPGDWWTEREARRLRRIVLPPIDITCARHAAEVVR